MPLVNLMYLALFSSSVATSTSALKTEIFIKPQKIAENPIFKSNYRYDNNERNTSAAYDLWNQADHTLFEWPGNITAMDSNHPLLKWGRARSKYVQSPCENTRGMELAAYAHKYVHLTWGINRLTKSYCEPLRVDRRYLPTKERQRKTFELTVVDFDFVFDAFLVVTAKGYIVRVGDIELNYRIKPGNPEQKLSYSIPQGFASSYVPQQCLTEPVSKIVVQKCCSKSPQSCPQGDAIVAYQESSVTFRIFISYDGGYKFKQIALAVPKSSSFLHSLTFYPNWKRLVVLHGGKTKIYVDEFSSKNGSLALFKREKQLTIKIQGFIQSMRISNELSFLIWDDCNVWYALTGRNGLVLNRAIFYVHSSILIDTGEIGPTTQNVRHVIRPRHCFLGKHSVLSIGEEGKIGLLDKNNVFFYGVDLKKNLKHKTFPLVGVSTDLTLLLPQKKYTINPCFDRNNRPKLLYPPRYLTLTHKQLMNENYKKRLSMRIVKKTLFPSDFMPTFFEENLNDHLPLKYKHLAISRCMTSTMSVDGSLSQKPKTILLNSISSTRINVTFYAYDKKSRQLNFEPSDLSYFMNIQLNRLASVVVGDSRFWLKYEVVIELKQNYWRLFQNKDIFLLNLYTIKSLRCVHQPQSRIWIKVDSFYKPSRSIHDFNDQLTPPKVNARTFSEKMHIEEIQDCPLQAEFDRQPSAVCTSTKLF